MNVKLLSILSFLVASAVLLATASHAQGRLQSLRTRHVHEEVLKGQARPVGHVPGSQMMRFDITLSLSRPGDLQQFLQAVYDNSSPQFRQFVTPEQFTDRFGPTQSDSDQVVAFAKKHGFRLLGGSRHQMNLQFEGSVADIESAFHVSLNTYQHPVENRLFFSPDREPTTDEPLAIWHISGLDNFSIPHPASSHTNHGEQPNSAITYEGYYLSSVWRTAYYGGALIGSGQSVGLFQFTPYNPADVKLTFSSSGQSNSVPINAISVGGATPICTTNCNLSAEGEPILDIVQVASMAPGLEAINVYVGTSDTAILSVMSVHSPLDKQISSSWTWRPADPASDDPYFWRIAAQGQSYFNATGDHGNYADYALVYEDFRAADFYPADDAWVTAVGGTTLTPNPATGVWESETAWSVPSGCNLTSGIGYCWMGGGGVSPDGIAIPWYQSYPIAEINVKNSSTTLRNVPDVSANAGPFTYVCASVGAGGSQVCEGWDGTSAAAPLWAGYMALVNQQAALDSKGPVGFINPYIYDLGARGGSGYTNAFHDIADGSSNGTGYYAVPGYDLVTGWGSPNGAGLLDALTNKTLQRIGKPVGVIAHAGAYPYTFVVGTGGSLWLNYRNGVNAYPWVNLGNPAKLATTGPPVQISIASTVGVIDNAGAYPYTFVTGADGNLWTNYWSGSAWRWFNLGKPSSAGISGAVGVIAHAGSYPYTFVTGTDGNLWLNYWSGSAWEWANLEKPSTAGISKAVGVIDNAGAYPYAFVTGTDGNLWLNYWTGSAWKWANLEKPSTAGISKAVGVIAHARSYPYTFVIGTDGNLWLNYWTGSAWEWLDLGKPVKLGSIGPPVQISIASAVGVIDNAGAYPYTFVTGADGNLWLSYWNGSAWKWANQEKPSGAGISGHVGVIAVDGSYPYALVTGTDGNLWLNGWSGSAWLWLNLGEP